MVVTGCWEILVSEVLEQLGFFAELEDWETWLSNFSVTVRLLTLKK